jgi:hypothetical protein
MLSRLKRIRGSGVGERRSRVQGFIVKVIIRGSVELIGAGPHRIVKIPAAGLAVFCGKIAGLDRDFLDGVNARLHILVLLPPKAVCRILAFDADGLRAGRHPVNSQRVFALKNSAWEQSGDLQRVTDIANACSASGERQEGNAVDAVIVDVVA